MAHEITLTQDGFTFLDMNIRPINSQTMAKVRYKVDTGANCTTISKKRLAELGYDENWIKSGKLLKGDERPTAATGLPIDDCYVVTLPEISIGEWVGYNWPFMTSLSVPFKFLLGTDSMRFFNWNFDYENDLCKFDLIPGKRKMLFNQKEQSIHSIDDIEKK
ncbi:MAG: retropepsin-like domain-containing protein [Defluviitaleaceae bacterium]|nr:retropepsin-like domain-containing protein [Defluviitaleaceae bacterium]